MSSLTSQRRLLTLLQTEVTQIRLLLLELSDEGLLCLIKWKYDISVTNTSDVTSNFFVPCTNMKVYISVNASSILFKQRRREPDKVY